MSGNRQIDELYERLKSDFPFEGYVETASEIGKDLAQLVLKVLPLGSKILDFGSGGCDKTALLSRLGYDCYACDDLCDEWHLENNNRELIMSFAQRENIKFHLIEDGVLPRFEKDFFDGVLIIDMIEHLHNSPRDLLNYLIDILRPQGFSFVAVPNSVNIRKRISVLVGKTNYCSLESFYFSKQPWRGHVREYTQMETEKLLRYQGLKVVSSSCINTVLHKHEKLRNRYVKLVYKTITNMFPRWRDSILVIGQKPKNWKLIPYNPDMAKEYTKRPTIRVK